MESLRTEEEQLATIKRFWKNYGSAILLGLVLSVGSVYGYRAWQKHQIEQKTTASALYQEMLEIVMGEGSEPSDNQKATLAHLGKALQTDFSGTVYAQFTAFFLARDAVNAGDLAGAAQLLRELLAQQPDREIEVIARLRLAQVLLAQGGEARQNEALGLLDQMHNSDSFKASMSELRGDILFALGRRDEARQAYESAVNAAIAEAAQRPLAQMKLDDLAERKEESK